MNRISTTLMLFIAISTPAVAADQGYFAYGDWGIFSLSGAPVKSLDGIRIGGGYDFNPYVGVEAGLFIISDLLTKNNNSDSIRFSPYTDESMSISSDQVAVVGTIPLDHHRDLVGKLGWATTTLDYQYSHYGSGIQTVTGSGSATKTNPMFGIAWKSAPDQHVRFIVQYENLGKIKMTASYSDQSSSTYDIKVEIISVGILYDF